MNFRASSLSLVLGLGLWGFGCNEEPVPCWCEGTVPEGMLRVACGGSTCLGGTGYRCTETGETVSFPAACSDAGVAGEGGLPAVDSGSGGIDSGTPALAWTVFLDDARLSAVRDIWSAGPRDTWFVTASGKVIHWTGETMPTSWDFGRELHGVYGVRDDVWVVGENGTIGVFDGADQFDILSIPDDGTFYDTFGTEERRYVAGDVYGGLRSDTPPFESYTPFEVGDGRGGTHSGGARCVSGTLQGLWVCTGDGVVGFDGEWHAILDRPAVAVAPVSAGLAVAVEPTSAWLIDFRTVALSGGFGPHGLAVPTEVERGDVRLTAVWGDATEVWIVGTGGYVGRMVGYTNPLASWQRIDVGTTRDLSSIHADAESIWIGGDSIILRRDR